jgi:hypothetical protein
MPCSLWQVIVQQSVIAGLDPAIHPSPKNAFRRMMDARVKPAHDELGKTPAWSMIRKSGYRFSLATNAKRLRGDHAQTKR